eukprot:SAG31_NODE_3179_length_4583_cov_1.884478_5_plen_81_part_00
MCSPPGATIDRQQPARLRGPSAWLPWTVSARYPAHQIAAERVHAAAVLRFSLHFDERAPFSLNRCAVNVSRTQIWATDSL